MSGDDRSDQDAPRSVAELLAAYGSSEGKNAQGGGRRRRRRAEDASEAAPQEIIERVLSDSGRMRRIRDDELEPPPATPPPPAAQPGPPGARPDPSAVQGPPPAARPPGPAPQPPRSYEGYEDPYGAVQYGGASATPYPDQAYPEQAYPDQGYPDQAYPAQAYPEEGYPDRGFPADHPDQAYPNRDYPERDYDDGPGPDARQPAGPPPPHAAPAGPRGYPGYADDLTATTQHPVIRDEPDADLTTSVAGRLGGGDDAPPTRREPMTEQLPRIAVPPDFDDESDAVAGAGTTASEQTMAGTDWFEDSYAGGQIPPYQDPPEDDHFPAAASATAVSPMPGIAPPVPGVSASEETQQQRIVDGGDEYLDDFGGLYGDRIDGHPSETPAPSDPADERYDDYGDLDDAEDDAAFDGRATRAARDDLDEYDDYEDGPYPEDGTYRDGDEADADAEEEEERRSPLVEWLVMAGQLIGGVVGGGALWLAFQWLWESIPPLALGLALLVTTGLVFAVRRIRRTDDLNTTLFTVLVGLIVTVSPAALLLLGL
ncbi:hypothetical protein [Actinoalloteichus sp. GBA129-24]|uniref:hypothetical protein n=1 Tax=Actinoalloteichus sp. GBA129-24 TaxID=1612551 RepID=UPI0009509B71|nr:hypothetical protein [Actinoalloteichus sp. GBA129-24]APU18490.1 hypothetical protein UA75_02255 [Actinoalloteichus sp. GBA129-24]